MLEIRVVNSTPADTEPKSPGHSRSEASVKLTVGSRANGLAVFMAARGEGIWHYRHFQSAEIGYFIRLIGLILKRHVVLKTRAAAAGFCMGDVWNDRNFWPECLYERDPVIELVGQGITVLINISASPYTIDKRALRREMLQSIAINQHRPVVYVNQFGGDDSLIFDGASLALTAEGKVAAQALAFEEDLVLFDTVTGEGEIHEQVDEEIAYAYQALVRENPQGRKVFARHLLEHRRRAGDDNAGRCESDLPALSAPLLQRVQFVAGGRYRHPRVPPTRGARQRSHRNVRTTRDQHAEPASVRAIRQSVVLPDQ